MHHLAPLDLATEETKNGTQNTIYHRFSSERWTICRHKLSAEARLWYQWLLVTEVTWWKREGRGGEWDFANNFNILTSRSDDWLIQSNFLFLCFLHHHCLSNMPPTFLTKMFLFNRVLVTKLSQLVNLDTSVFTWVNAYNGNNLNSSHCVSCL